MISPEERGDGLARGRTDGDYSSPSTRILVPDGRDRLHEPRRGATMIRSLALLASLSAGALIGYLDAQGTGVVVVALLLVGGGCCLAMLRPANGLLFATTMALGLPAVRLLAPMLGLAVGGASPATRLVALVPALGGALIGMAARQAFMAPARTMRRQ